MEFTKVRRHRMQPTKDGISPTTLYLALSVGINFGWGVCSHYLRQELARMYSDVRLIEDNMAEFVKGCVFQALTDNEFNPLQNVKGSRNFGYTFFENELTPSAIERSRQYDCILAGSSWCLNKIRCHGVNNCELLLQGVDLSRFSPLPTKQDNGQFVIFSGGKFELRKGQDLVLHAFKVLQKKYRDMILVNCWYNSWPESIRLFRFSKYIDWQVSGNDWQEFIQNIYKKNGMDPSRIITHDLIDNQNLKDLYSTTDIGVFPNRCEGGSNLVLMEYMACGKPVIASHTSGHKDILTKENALLLDRLEPFQIYQEDGQLWADWEEPSVDQLVSQIEYAYHNRDRVRQLAVQAGNDLQEFSWTDSAKSLLNTLTKYGAIGEESLLENH